MRSLDSTRIAFAAMVTGSLLLGCSSEKSPAGPVPLADSVATMQPRAVWQHFYELTQVPRPSHHEAKATDFVARFGRSLGLETIVDEAGNVIIRKPATPGREGAPGVVLQSHLDMVPQSDDGSFDFETTPLTALVQDGWVHAERTTLGADDGIGVAMVMALLESSSLTHGPLEALFTVNEEDGMDGINGLAEDVLKGRMYINVDGEIEGSFVISSAGGVNIDVRAVYPESATPTGMTGYQVTIGGLLGGHSGMDIAKGRGSAHQLIARLLVNAPAALGVRLSSLLGGDTYNVIPGKATAIVAVPSSQADAFRSYVTELDATAKSELAKTDPGVTVTANPTSLPRNVMDAAAQTALMGAVYAAPQGVHKMSGDVPGLVETSCNLGILEIGDGQFIGGALARSQIDSERDAEAQRFAAVYAAAGAATELKVPYPSWPPNTASPLLAVMEQVYTHSFGTTPIVTAVHAGLETSTALAKYPGMDLISVGPTLENVHSTRERLDVASVSKAYELLGQTLAAIE